VPSSRPSGEAHQPGDAGGKEGGFIGVYRDLMGFTGNLMGFSPW